MLPAITWEGSINTQVQTERMSEKDELKLKLQVLKFEREFFCIWWAKFVTKGYLNVYVIFFAYVILEGLSSLSKPKSGLWSD